MMPGLRQAARSAQHRVVQGCWLPSAAFTRDRGPGSCTCEMPLPCCVRDRAATHSHESCPVDPSEFGAHRVAANNPHKGIPPRSVNRKALKASADGRRYKHSNLIPGRRVESNDPVGVARRGPVTTADHRHLISSGKECGTGESATIDGAQRIRLGKRLGPLYEDGHGTGVLDSKPASIRAPGDCVVAVRNSDGSEVTRRSRRQIRQVQA